MTIPNVGDLKIEFWYQIVIVISVIFLYVGLTQEILICKNEYVVQISLGALLFSLAQWMEKKYLTQFSQYGFSLLKFSWSKMIKSPFTVFLKILGFILIINPILEHFIDFSIFIYLKELF